MKAILPSLLAFLLPLSPQLHAQGTVKLDNNSSTAITNSLTGLRVVAGTTFRVAIYGAPDGTTDENLLVAFGAPTGIAPAAGLFTGGTRTAPMVAPQQFGIFQYRAWETAYGSNYEQAAAAAAMNGRAALVGKSGLVRVQTGDPANSIPPGNLIGNGLQGFVLGYAPGSSLSINDVVVSEGTNGTREANFTVTLNLPRAETVSVDFATTNGSALAGSDYIATNGTVVFAPGESNKTIAVVITADAPAEPDEDFFVNLSNAAGAPIARALGKCVITEVRVDGISVDVAVRFNTVAQRHYVLERSDDLATWTVVIGAENVPGTGTFVTAVDRNAGCAANRTYRARLLD